MNTLCDRPPVVLAHAVALGVSCWALVACSTAGSVWMAQPLTDGDDSLEGADPLTGADPSPPAPKGTAAPTRRILGPPPTLARPVVNIDSNAHPPRLPPTPGPLEGRVLGSFKNTYYDFPNEADYQGPTVGLMNAECRTIKSVPRPFYEAVCVQGSGRLTNGTTVSFNRRDCGCAEVCPRTGQRICFDALDIASYPWGRGATGQAITPLLTVAVDTEVIPINTPVYIPEFDGLPRDPDYRAMHDGCFIVQDRGVGVKGAHIDVFTGHPAMTRLWNKLVPSNKGVTVVVDSPRCARAESMGSVGP
jgi:3D (Asp-Asp-Asp) domain-containing protein